ncbi:MAG: 30S ribosomal protein S6 [Candidatus Omnitrophota bacterium]|jgi:small subunit ribosomal protein S6
MNNYEGIFIIKHELKEEEIKQVFATISDSVTKSGGAIKKEENWGKRQLIYPIKKAKEGYYYRLDFTAPPSAITTLEGTYKLNPDILRVMISKR